MPFIFILLAFLSFEQALAQPSAENWLEFEPQASGETYYVSPDGDDANSGLSEAEAFQTLQYAADQLEPGDTALVMDGTYSKPNSDHVVEIKTSGEPDNWIFFRAHPGHEPLITVEDNYTGIYTYASYIVVDGFTLQGDAPDMSLAFAQEQQNDLELRATKGSGVRAYPKDGVAPHHLIFRNNTVFDMTAQGVTANGADYVRIEDNVVSGGSKYSSYATSAYSFYQSRHIDDFEGIKMVIRRNVAFDNENLIPFYFSNPDNPEARVITDGNGVIIDDHRNTQSIVGDSGVAYVGTTLVENNLLFDNGGRGVNVYSSDNVIVRYNTSYHNARSSSGAIDSEFVVGNASNVEVYGNIFVPRAGAKYISSYGTKAITFRDNLFHGGTGAPEYTPGTLQNLVRNGDFSGGTSGWEVTGPALKTSGKDARGRFCLDSDGSEEVALIQGGLDVNVSRYSLMFETFGDAAGEVTAALIAEDGELFSGTVSDWAEETNRSFELDLVTSASARLEFRVPAGAAGRYCFDDIELVGSSNLLADPMFVSPNLDFSAADFSLQPASPARGAGTDPFPGTDLEGAPRPSGERPDLGALEGE